MESTIHVFFIVLLLCICAFVDVYSWSLHRYTDVGEAIGFEDTWGGRTIQKFFAIPYAEAPVGDLRFRPPMLKLPYPYPFRADEFGPSCPYKGNMGLIFSEEKWNNDTNEGCLYLNIYVPLEGEPRKAVMVWFHGGAFSVGSGMHFDGSKMAALGDVIVVTINYRLGLLGFFTTGDESAPGNYGLLDQQFALKWVNRNIEVFGGDKNRVTIFGESAGAASVTWQMLAPSNQGLFHRVIAQSGTALSPWAFPEPEVTKQYTNRLLKKLGCANSDTREIVTCLRGRSPEAFLSNGLFDYPNYQLLKERIPIGPRVDGDFIPYSPKSRLPTSRLEDQPFFRSLDLLIGGNRYEGSPFLSAVLRPFFEASVNQSIFDGVTKEVFRSCVEFWATKDDDVANALWSLYGTSANGNTKDLMQPQELLEFIGDAAFHDGTIKFLKRHAAKTSETSGSTYMYSFLPLPSKSLGGIAEALEKESWVDGAKHTDDLIFLFGRATVKENEETMMKGEVDLSDAMITYWTNFAKTGDPNKPAPVPHQWPQYKIGEEEFIEFDIQNKQLDLRTNAFFRKKHMSFWQDILPVTERPRAEREETTPDREETTPDREETTPDIHVEEITPDMEETTSDMEETPSDREDTTSEQEEIKTTTKTVKTEL